MRISVDRDLFFAADDGCRRHTVAIENVDNWNSLSDNCVINCTTLHNFPLSHAFALGLENK